MEQIYARIDALKSRDAEVLTHRPTSELFFWPLGAAFMLVTAFHSGMALGVLRAPHRESELQEALS